MLEIKVMTPAEYDALISRISTLENMLQTIQTGVTVRERLLPYSNNGMICGGDIRKVMNWHNSTFLRKIKAGILPVTKDGNRWVMNFDEFVAWYSKYLMLKQNK